MLRKRQQKAAGKSQNDELGRVDNPHKARARSSIKPADCGAVAGYARPCQAVGVAVARVAGPLRRENPIPVERLVRPALHAKTQAVRAKSA